MKGCVSLLNNHQESKKAEGNQMGIIKGEKKAHAQNHLEGGSPKERTATPTGLSVVQKPETRKNGRSVGRSVVFKKPCRCHTQKAVVLLFQNYLNIILKIKETAFSQIIFKWTVRTNLPIEIDNLTWLKSLIHFTISRRLPLPWLYSGKAFQSFTWVWLFISGEISL